MSDWRRYDDYPKLGSSDPKEWAWEFLRRNPNYRSDFARYARVSASIDALPPRYSLSRHPNQSLDCWNCSPPAKPGETLIRYKARRRRIGPIVRWDKVFARRWGLLKPVDPALRYSADQVVFQLSERIVRSNMQPPMHPKLVRDLVLRPGEVLLRIDLRGDYKDQLKHIADQLAADIEREQLYAYPKRFKLWREFHLMLRYFDARVQKLGEHGLSAPWKQRRRKRRLPLREFRGSLLIDAKLSAAFKAINHPRLSYVALVSELDSHRFEEWDRYLERITLARGHLALANTRLAKSSLGV